MLFNSQVFLIFFVVVYGLYRLLPHRWQNVLLLVSSYFFYGWWDWRFLTLIFLSTVIDYIAGGIIYSAGPNQRRRKAAVVVSMTSNLVILGFFKYFNFFADNLSAVLQYAGLPAFTRHLNIILPVGISFYTFQAMSYALDIYRGHLKPARSFLNFATFVAYFPQLVAGPIERASNLLPQIENPRTITRAGIESGAWLIFWGLFKKCVIADNLAVLVDGVFGATGATGATSLLALYAFAFQILCDFSGYSDIARGLARWMGVELMLNFNNPYAALNPKDFWSRWHISLSSWLRDYLYIPLGGEPERSSPNVHQSCVDDAAGRSLARRGLDICDLGRFPRLAAGDLSPLGRKVFTQGHAGFWPVAETAAALDVSSGLRGLVVFPGQFAGAGG